MFRNTFCSIQAIARQHHHILDATFTQSANGIRSFFTRRVANANGTRQLSANAEVNHGRSTRLFVNNRLVCFGNIDLFIFNDKVLASDDHALALERSCDTVRHDVLHIGMFFGVIDIAFHCRLDNRTSHAMREMFLDACRNFQDSLFGIFAKRNNLFKPRFCLRERSRLVEHNRIGKSKFFQVLAALHRQVHIRRFTQRRNHGNRRRELYRARVIHHQDGNRTRNILRQQERKPKAKEAKRHDAIGQMFRTALYACLQVFATVDQFHDLLDFRIAVDRMYLHENGTFFKNSPGKNDSAGGLHHRLGFTRHRRFIHKGFAFNHATIDRNHATGTDADQVIDLDVLHIHQSIYAVFHNPDLIYLDGEATCQSCARTRLGVIFQQARHAQKEHDRSGRFVIALQQRSANCSTVQNIDGELSAHKRRYPASHIAQPANYRNCRANRKR